MVPERQTHITRTIRDVLRTVEGAHHFVVGFGEQYPLGDGRDVLPVAVYGNGPAFDVGFGPEAIVRARSIGEEIQFFLGDNAVRFEVKPQWVSPDTPGLRKIGAIGIDPIV